MPIKTVHGLPDRSDEFINFGEAYSEGVVIPKGLFKDQQGKGLYYDYFIHNTSAEREIIPNVRYSIEDADNNSLVYVSKDDSLPNKFYLGYEDFLHDWIIPIRSSGFLEIGHLSMEGSQLVLAGQFQGALIFGNQQITNTNSGIAAVVMRVSNTGNLINSRIVRNFDVNWPLTFERSGNDLLVSGRTGDMALGIDVQSAIVGSLPNQSFTLRQQLSSSNYQYQSNNLTASSGMTLLKTTHSQFNGNRTYLFSGTGIIQVNSQTISQSAINQLTLINLTPAGTLAWVKTVNTSSNDPFELDLTEGDSGSLFLGLTFRDTLMANNQSIASIGGKDIAILRYDLNGELAGIKCFGSTDDETVKRCLYSRGNLYFGGSYRGLTFERSIGSNIYENYPGDSVYSKAYITFLPNDSFLNLTGNRQMASNPIKPLANNFVLQAFPNPFTDKFQILLQSDVTAEHIIQLVNPLGVIVWQKDFVITEGKNFLTVDNLKSLPIGIYAISIRSSDNKLYTCKILKL